MKEKIYAIIATVAETHPKKIHRAQELNADLGIDSLKLIDLVLGVEDEFSITLSEDALASITTVDELEEHIGSLLAEPQQS